MALDGFRRPVLSPYLVFPLFLINYVIISGQNVDSMIFKEVMHELARKLGHLGKDFTDTWNGDVS